MATRKIETKSEKRSYLEIAGTNINQVLVFSATEKQISALRATARKYEDHFSKSSLRDIRNFITGMSRYSGISSYIRDLEVEIDVAA